MIQTINGEDEGVNYWWLNASPKIWSFSNIEVGQSVEYTSVNDNGHKRKIYKNFENVKVEILLLDMSHIGKAIVAICKISQEHDGERIWVEKYKILLTLLDIVICLKLMS